MSLDGAAGMRRSYMHISFRFPTLQGVLTMA
jgi:hypothetical protein